MSLSLLASSLGAPLFAQDDFIGSTLFFVIMGAVFLGLVGALVFLRNKKEDD